jgi:pilus assembly protein CpaD
MTFSPIETAVLKPAASVLSRAALVFCGLALAGCTDRLATGSTISDEYQMRHPIVLAERPVTLTLFASRKLDDGSKRRILEFANEAKIEGAPVVEILAPTGAFNDAEARALVPAVKAALRQGGVEASITIGSYPAPDPRAMSPLRLSYRAVRAQVSHRCGEWPLDLASASSLESWDNRPYWNLGCSYQNMIATQLDDPRDLEAPRATTPGDVQMRTRAIGVARQGGDAGGRSGPTASTGSSASTTQTGAAR